jgi:hypothetical protein
MRSSLRTFPGHLGHGGGLGIVAGCHNDKDDVPTQSAPGGVLSGNEFQRNRAARGTALDTTGSNSTSPLNASHQTAGAGGTAGTTAGTPTGGANQRFT